MVANPIRTAADPHAWAVALVTTQATGTSTHVTTAKCPGTISWAEETIVLDVRATPNLHKVPAARDPFHHLLRATNHGQILGLVTPHRLLDMLTWQLHIADLDLAQPASFST